MNLGVHIVLVAIATSGCYIRPDGPMATDGSGSGDLRANYMFLTSQRYVANEIANPDDADAKCNLLAEMAGLPGTYIAWISSESAGVHAVERFPLSARGWIRRDGKPFADRLEAVTARRLFYPPRKDEYGNDKFFDQDFVYTGTNPSGMATGFDCDGGSSEVTMGVADATGGNWTKLEERNSCNGTQWRLYCFGIDREVEVLPEPAPMGAWRAFLTPMDVGVPGNGKAGLDAECDQKGKSAFMGGEYKSLVALSNMPARKVLEVGHVGGWYRADDVKLVDDSTFVEFAAPLNVTATGGYLEGYVYSGAGGYDDFAALNCADWTVVTGADSLELGDSTRSGTSAFGGGGNRQCDTSHRLHCFQTGP